jgi:PAS domain S-box-containing protein
MLAELANDFAFGLTTLKLRQEKLHADELTRKQASLIDLCPDAIIVKKLEGEITFWSEGAEKLYGWTKLEAIGQKTQNLLKTKFPTLKENMLKELEGTGKWTGELRHQTKDGQKRVVQSYWRATINSEGKVEEIMETNVDITDRKEMQNKLQEYTAHLEELVEERTQQLKDTERLTAIGETAGMVGHDLRNPLQTITGEMYLAKAELAELPNSPQKLNLQETVATIADQVGYMNKIVSDLQDFVKPISPEKTSIDLRKLILDTLKDVSVPANIEAKSNLEENLPMISADAQLLRRVLFNLFNNAVQAMPSGGDLNVETQLKHEPNGQNSVVIVVGDTGEGISDAIRGKSSSPCSLRNQKGKASA